MDEILSQCRTECSKAVDALKAHYQRLRTGRANVAMLDDIRVDYYGTATPLTQVANLSSPDPKLIVISPWDTSQIKAIMKAVQTSDLGITPSSDGKVVRLPIPPLSGDRRKELTKTAKTMLEDCRVGIRNHRRIANEKISALLKAKEITEDEKSHAHDTTQKIHDEAIKAAEEIFHHKEKELQEI